MTDNPGKNIDKKNIDKKGNFLDLVPEKTCQWEKTGDNKINLMVPRFKNRWLKKIAARLGKTEIVRIAMDDNGSLVWQLIDGSNTVDEIGRSMANLKTDDESIEQVYQRLMEFITILSRNRFIRFKNYRK
jgi:hypothetical protein